MATYTEFHQPDIASDRQHSQNHWHGKNGLFFRHNRCQEELEMYKSNGLVAQRRPTLKTITKELEVVRHCKCSTKKPPTCTSLMQLAERNYNPRYCQEKVLDRYIFIVPVQTRKSRREGIGKFRYGAFLTHP
ncbi:unnamed protein product [Prunus armeniaca]|uniref:Uncharacterized protein n=1 Tax=Prunus armeniaca TaxID=36596 RepID=A0A6J5TWN9_PRUAR|nr:unnamed protein product [Prunus armeniaca]